MNYVKEFFIELARRPWWIVPILWGLCIDVLPVLALVWLIKNIFF